MLGFANFSTTWNKVWCGSYALVLRHTCGCFKFANDWRFFIIVVLFVACRLEGGRIVLSGVLLLRFCRKTLISAYYAANFNIFLTVIHFELVLSVYNNVRWFVVFAKLGNLRRFDLILLRDLLLHLNLLILKLYTLLLYLIVCCFLGVLVGLLI